MSGSGLPYTENANVFLVVASLQPREVTTGNTSVSAGYRVATLKKKTFHWPCISKFSSVFLQVIDILYFFPQHMVMVKRISRQKKWLVIKRTFNLFLLDLSLTLPRSTIFHDFKNLVFARDSYPANTDVFLVITFFHPKIGEKRMERSNVKK